MAQKAIFIPTFVHRFVIAKHVQYLLSKTHLFLRYFEKNLNRIFYNIGCILPIDFVNAITASLFIVVILAVLSGIVVLLFRNMEMSNVTTMTSAL